MGADAVLAVVVERAQPEAGFAVAPAALDGDELLVGGGQVLGGQRGVGGAQQPLAVVVGFARGGGAGDAQQPGLGAPQLDNTSASSGEITRSRSASVFDGVICSSGMSSPVLGKRLDEAVVGQVGQFLDADSGVPQHLHHSPGPEPAVFFEAEVAAPTGVGVLGPDAAGGLGLQHRPDAGSSRRR